MRYSIETCDMSEVEACGCCTTFYDLYNVKVLSSNGHWLEVEGGQDLKTIEQAYEVVIEHLGGKVEYDN